MRLIEDLTFLNRQFLSNSLWAYLKFLLILGAGFTGIQLLRFFLFDRIHNLLKKISVRADKKLGRMLENRLLPLMYILVFFLGCQQLYLSPFLEQLVKVVVVISGVVITVLVIQKIIIFFLYRYWNSRERDASEYKLLNISIVLVQGFLWILALLFLLENFGIKIKGLLAGLGIGGIAIAFAAQALLSDFFSYFTIFLDRPFDIGDFIIIGDLMGTVEHIGLKTTRIRSLGGEELIFPNTDLTNSRIKNYKRMENRRIKFEFGVKYETPAEQLREIPGIIKEIIEDIENTRFDRAHFASFGEYNLVFEVVYYVLSKDYAVYMDIQQQINLAIKQRLEARGVEFAYPTRTLYLGSEAAESGLQEAAFASEDGQKPDRNFNDE